MIKEVVVMNNKVFLGFFKKDDEIIDETYGGHEIFAIENEQGLYNELLTGLEFERARFEDNKGLTILICQRIDPNVRSKEINRYKYFYDKDSINNLIDKINSLTLTKHK